MANVSRQKQKLLLMEQLFKEKSDEAHAITGSALIDILAEMGIKAERKTIYDDIATLTAAGHDMRTTKIGHSNAYYLGDRLFTDDELSALCTIVCSSRDLTNKKAGELLKKLQTLTNVQKSGALRREVHIENRTKSAQDELFSVIGTVEEAIFADRQIEISVTDGHGENVRTLSKIVASPFHVVREDEKYFVILRVDSEDGANGLHRVRADKISQAQLLKTERQPLSETEEITVRKLCVPRESEGTAEQIRIRFDKKLSDEIYDKFGENTLFREDSDGSLYADVLARLSPDFWGWLFKFGKAVKVVSPSYVADIYCDKLKKLCEMYES